MFSSIREVVGVALTVLAVAGATSACGSEAPSSEFGPPPTEDAGGPGPGPGGGFGDPNDGGTNVDPSCKPLTCADQGIECGPAGNGCGGIIPDCGTCGPGLRCGGP